MIQKRRGRQSSGGTKRRQPSHSRSKRRALPSAELRLSVTLALAVVVGIGILGAFAWTEMERRDWADVAQVDDRSIDRAHLRGRLQLLNYLTDRREEALTQLAELGVDTASIDRVRRQLGETRADAVRVGLDMLIDEALIEAAGIGPDRDASPSDELTAVLSHQLDRHVRWLTVAPALDRGPGTQPSTWPQAPEASLPDAATAATIREQLSRELTAGKSIAGIEEELRSAGWTTHSGDGWLGESTSPAGLDEVAAEQARRAVALGPLSPTLDPSGRVTLVDLLAKDVVAIDGASAYDEARAAGVPEAALRDLARARLIARAVRANLEAQWATKSMKQARAIEVVIGPADNPGSAGPWVQLAHLVVTQAGSAPDSLDHAKRVADKLRALPVDQRFAAFQRLVTEANASAGAGAIGASGELGFFTREQVNASVSSLAFAPTARTGDVLGPIQTAVGQELFLVEATYSGPLDDRTIAAVLEARRTSDLAGLAVQVWPLDALRGKAQTWRVESEVPAGGNEHAAIFELPSGALWGPVNLDERVTLVQVLERREARPDAQQLARLQARGFDAWLAGIRNRASIWKGDDPFPDKSPASRETAPLPSFQPARTPILP